MKEVLFFYLLALLTTTAIAIHIENDYEHGENGWYVPQQDGSWIWLNKDEAEQKLAELKTTRKAHFASTPVSYHLYTASNPTKNQPIFTTTESIDGSNFNATNPTRFIIHGWTQSYQHSLNRKIRDAWLIHGDHNIIAVDWPSARSFDYASCVAAVPIVGEKVANIIDFLVVNYNMSLKSLAVIGHSLGAHVAGFAGKNVQSGQIYRIVGLDPALPMYDYDDTEKRLTITDAIYVESIHTNGGRWGFLKPIGKASFYPNGGKTQPGCILDLTNLCHHDRSNTYYAEAVEKNSFPSMECENYEDAVAKSCGSTYSCVRMGSMTNEAVADGEYYVPVKRKSPFGIDGEICSDESHV